MNNWIDGLSENELRKTLAASVQTLLAYVDEASGDVEDICLAMAHPLQYFGPAEVRANFWPNVRHELYLLICTDDPKYAEIRRRLDNESNKINAVIVGLVSAAVSAVLGLTAGVLAPFVALCLIALARVGKEAWCASFSADEETACF